MDLVGPGIDGQLSRVEVVCRDVARQVIGGGFHQQAQKGLLEFGSGQSGSLSIRRRRAASRIRSTIWNEPPRSAATSRSFASKNLAHVQPWPSAPMRFSTGTRTLTNETALISAYPSAVAIGCTVIPGASMSTRINEMPACGLTIGSVRARKNIRVACCANVTHTFSPLTTYASPSRTADVRSDARSEPAFGSEKP